MPTITLYISDDLFAHYYKIAKILDCTVPTVIKRLARVEAAESRWTEEELNRG